MPTYEILGIFWINRSSAVDTWGGGVPVIFKIIFLHVLHI